MRDVIPFGMAHGPLADLIGPHVIGHARRGAAKADVQRCAGVSGAVLGEGEFRTRVDRAAGEYFSDLLVGKIIDFIRSQRGAVDDGPKQRGGSGR